MGVKTIGLVQGKNIWKLKSKLACYYTAILVLGAHLMVRKCKWWFPEQMEVSRGCVASLLDVEKTESFT